METLIDHLVSVLQQVPDSPMSPECIGIQSRGMKQWVSLEVAKKTGICSNMQFVYPRQMVDQLLSYAGFSTDHTHLLNEDILYWSILKQSLSENLSTGPDPFQDYIQGNHGKEKKQHQLALKISRIFDDYQIYRPDMLASWHTEPQKNLLADTDVQWQKRLWNRITGKNFQDCLAFKTTRFLTDFENLELQQDHFPQRIFLFGISSFPPVFLQMFEKISHIIDVHIFFLVPSNQFFYDLKSKKQLDKLSLKQMTEPATESLYYETSNPLLSGLGTLNRSFLNFLENFDYHEPAGDLFCDPLEDSESMLTQIQSDILNLVHRRNGSANVPVNIPGIDHSISIHACHSAMRETQVLKDILINAFKQDPDLCPHDIIVMMPDIESYAPFIEAVFSSEHTLGFSISDRKKHSESQTLTAFLKILALKTTRLEKTQVLDLLLCPPVTKKFNISVEDLLVIQKMTEDARILWGKDANHRKELGLPAIDQNTWHFGFARLFMGMAMPEEYDALVKNVLPCASVEGLDYEILGKFASFAQTLFCTLEGFAKDKPVSGWCQEFKQMIDGLIEQDSRNHEDILFLLGILEEMKTHSQAAGLTHPVSFDVISATLENKLGQNISHGNFLSGNISFCNLMPMRSIPYKIVALMGMDEKSFPRKQTSAGFDLIRKYPRFGDKSERDEDRQLFLETLLSARNQLIITYTGMSIKDNSQVPCSSVVSEFCDTLDHSFIFEDNYSYHVFHPLHPFDETYFLPDTTVPSYSGHQYKIALALQKKNNPQVLFADMGQSATQKAGVQIHKSVEETVEITLDSMIRFFKNPVQEYMKQTLDIQFAVVDELSQDREAFTVSGLDQYAMGNDMLNRYSSKNASDLYSVLKAQGTLPLGEKARLEYARILSMAQPLMDVKAAVLSKSPLPSLPAQITIGTVTVSSVLDNIYCDGVYFSDFGKLNSKRLLPEWIRHLFLNLTAPDDYPCTTFLAGQDPDKKAQAAVLCFLPVKDNARDYFFMLLDMYKKGLQSPLYFFVETAWQIAKALEKDNFTVTLENRSAVYKKAMATWHGSDFFPGESRNRYLARCMEACDPFRNMDAFYSSDIVQNAVRIYQPMLDHMERIS
ncbi:MAG: exodeoxyribonuclease V subunit gamma [Proteobacteria bacterium]|nr:exodeoxyribonuclease V subunit gamma [Pseudomonadota bacterium]MBU1386319.1 exodeoxyribonuclease V subunit gamma [Pseudomonadota bacterium]MBU1543933.1 exodeoxyribonuclease V subunit gamma [Pseudomonadota bacterium]MBU2430128.1 exodeoxyribonuclease V subunit gamma [Pseudomonadota bacterium]MBU2482270.1 exodeoxyribonuclease V subunit gamma [Pseudomonadota bacterium]